MSKQSKINMPDMKEERLKTFSQVNEMYKPERYQEKLTYKGRKEDE